MSVEQEDRERFARWIDGQMSQQGWSPAELGRRSGIRNGRISDYRGARRLPGPKDAQRITLHELRHSCATLELAAGTPTKIVSGRLGHKNTATTSNLYQHVDLSLQQVAVDALEARIDQSNAG